jgi:hypothetical protein
VKEVKKAVLHDQLVKTRKQLESILHSFENSVGKKIFAKSEDIIPLWTHNKFLLNSIVLEIKIYSVQRVKGSREDKEGRTYT